MSSLLFHLIIICIFYIQNTSCNTYYVDPSTSSGGSGNSWNNAFNTLDEALAETFRQNDEIWLMGGYTYIPSNPSDRTDCFVTSLKLTIYGGFDGSESNTGQRKSNTASSILSGDIGISNDMTDNCYHVMQYNQELTLDNVIIQHGYADYNAMYTTPNKIYALQRYGGALITTDVGMRTVLYLNNVILRNNTAINGGALWFAAAPPATTVSVFIKDSEFIHNKAIDGPFEGGYGGAIYEMYKPNITLINTDFNYNEALNRGGAIYADYGADLYANGCTFDSNKAGGWGGAIFSEDRNSQTDGTFPKIISSTFRYNDAGVDGGAIYWYNGVIGTLTNNVFTSNTAPGPGTAISLIDSSSTSSGNTLTGNAEYSATTIEYTGIDDSLVFDIDQELTDLYSVWSTMQTEWDIYPFNAADDLCYVNIDNSDFNKDGSSWSKAYPDLQDCLDLLSANGGEIWVKTGTYNPTSVPQWKIDIGRSQNIFRSFEMYNGIRMYGGFDGTETSRYERNWRDNPTYLSCQVTNLIRCTQLIETADDALIDGFILEETGGDSARRRRLANSISIEQVLAVDTFAAGVLSEGDTVHIVNTIFHKLFTTGKGGAVYCIGLETVDGPNKSPSFTNVAFLGNRADVRGGAISADVYCNFICTSCKFDSNSASEKGGAIYLDFDCDPTFIDAVFTNNYAASGGCIAADGASLVVFNGTNAFTSNYAENEGGCFYSGSGVTSSNAQGFVFDDNIPVFSSNYMSNTGNIGHNDAYGWPFSTIGIALSTTPAPTLYPTTNPTSVPSNTPTEAPLFAPTLSPLKVPTLTPTSTPTHNPTRVPTNNPSISPTKDPTPTPTDNPTAVPTPAPTKDPTPAPTDNPTAVPTPAPTYNPTPAPTNDPTFSPTEAPSPAPTARPTEAPVGQDDPTKSPSLQTYNPTLSPTKNPTPAPTNAPTDIPSRVPSSSPTPAPTTNPTLAPTDRPTEAPVGQDDPTKAPSLPTRAPTTTPTPAPTATPILVPTENPALLPTAAPVMPSVSLSLSTTLSMDTTEDFDENDGEQSIIGMITGYVDNFGTGTVLIFIVIGWGCTCCLCCMITICVCVKWRDKKKQARAMTGLNSADPQTEQLFQQNLQMARSHKAALPSQSILPADDGDDHDTIRFGTSSSRFDSKASLIR